MKNKKLPGSEMYYTIWLCPDIYFEKWNLEPFGYFKWNMDRKIEMSTLSWFLPYLPVILFLSSKNWVYEIFFSKYVAISYFNNSYMTLEVY